MAALKHSNNLGGYHQLILLAALFPYLCSSFFLLVLSKHQILYAFCKSFFQGNDNTQGKGLASRDPTAVGLTDISQAFPQPGITPAGWHQSSHTRSPPFPWKQGQCELLPRTGEIIRPFDSKKFRSNSLAQWTTEILYSSGSLAYLLPFFHYTLAEIPGSARLMVKRPQPRYFLSLLLHGRRLNSCCSCFVQKWKMSWESYNSSLN